jgi:hypothetical protein
LLAALYAPQAGVIFMNNIRFSLALVFLFLPSFAFGSDLETLAQDYYDSWVKTQKPDATKESLRKYLAFLADDIGHQHLPYDPESTREPDNKEKILEGMTYYLGTHTKYSSNLKSVMTGYNLIVIKYSTKSEGIHPQTKEVIKQEYDTVEVLELESGKIAVIRKYSE